MNRIEFSSLLINPESIDALRTAQLDEVISEFPYLQSARAIQLKGLKKMQSYKYNQALKKTASYTIDRTVLFEFITSQLSVEFTTQQNTDLENTDTVESDSLEILHKKITDSVQAEADSIESGAIQKEEIEKKASEILEIGKPIQFKSSDSYSFNEWMKLVSYEPIIRQERADGKLESTRKKDDQSYLIDRFIASRPSINPIDKKLVSDDITFIDSSEKVSLMTETLAKVYLEQKKYENAIKAYHILSLKYPEKSGFFADRIKAIKILQKDKS